MTLLDLVTLVSAHTQSEADLLATVVGMVNGGSVRLCGNFKGARFDRDSGCGQLCHDISDVVVDDQADVRASRRRP